MAQLPHANFFHEGESNYTLNSPPVAPNFQYPGNVQNTESLIDFQPVSPCYMQPRLFHPNVPPPIPFPPRIHSVLPPVMKIPVGEEVSVNISSNLHYPQWPLHWEQQASHSGFSALIRHPLHSVETCNPTYLVDNSITAELPHKINAPVLEISEKCSVSCMENNPDQIWVNSWLQSHADGWPSHHHASGFSDERKLKVWAIKQCLQSCWLNLKELETMEEKMTMRCKKLENCDWDKMLEEVELRKALLRGNLGMIDANALENVKTTLLKRSKKRTRTKRKSLLGEDNECVAAERRKKRHLQIDTWLEKKQAEVDLQKREESLKHQADAVLWEVRLKQSEGRKILSLLNALVKLYQVRASKNELSENAESSETKGQFKQIIEKLSGLWEGQMRDYEAEERTLRVMLRESPEKGEQKNEMNKLERRFREWETALFGKEVVMSEGVAADCLPFFLNQSKSMDSLMQTRREWDQFISNSPLASAIPIGWVEPKEASSEEWRKLIK